MFMRPSRTPRPAPSGQDVIPVASKTEDTLAYYMPTPAKGPLREISALEQMYGYWSAE
ncbi:MAG: hypothetical protein WAK98_14985 [Gemmobacter sp.]|jgi:hypothetical protein